MPFRWPFSHNTAGKKQDGGVSIKEVLVLLFTRRIFWFLFGNRVILVFVDSGLAEKVCLSHVSKANKIIEI